MALLLPNAALCILQGDVEQELGEVTAAPRGDLDRRNAILARMFASELYMQGIPAVLVIPPLAPQSGVNALEHIAAALHAEPHPTRKTLIDVLANIQELILSGDSSAKSVLPAIQPDSESEAVWEQSLDACLYIAPDFDTPSSLITGA